MNIATLKIFMEERMFVDEVHNVRLAAGNGGDGCLSFRREKFIPKGGPNGGDGGNGGNVILVGDENTSDLSVYRFKPHARAKNGGHGMGSEMHGRNGKDCLLVVPVGTVILDATTKNFVTEITGHCQRVMLLRGGTGGKGNVNFKSSTNQAPRRTTPGTPGEEGTFDFILKTIADVGLVGFPNAGKSTLTTLLTRATPKIASYPFTTLHANVGIMTDGSGNNRVIIADIPGLIDRAHENRGLGIRFLKHIERCAILLFLIDMSAMDNRLPADDYSSLLNELSCYNEDLLKKEKVVVANKMDAPSAAKNLDTFQRKHGMNILKISCATGSGIDELKMVLRNAVRQKKCKNSVLSC
ncbi:MAG: GTPase ObgE [Puniceicoccales bacterium]|jgi:GTP-binding protein|nr:GTPase ObgE [Puniceicoccales bacterium]